MLWVLTPDVRWQYRKDVAERLQKAGKVQKAEEAEEKAKKETEEKAEKEALEKADKVLKVPICRCLYK